MQLEPSSLLVSFCMCSWPCLFPCPKPAGLRSPGSDPAGNLAAEALVSAGPGERMDVTSERLDGVMLMVGD